MSKLSFINVRKVGLAYLAVALTVLITPNGVVLAQSSAESSSASLSATTSADSSGDQDDGDSVSRTDIRVRTKELLERKERPSAEERAAQRDEFKRLSRQQQCDRRKLNLSARIEFYRTKHRDYTTAIEQLHINATRASARLKELEYDVTKLDSQIKDLEEYLFSVKSAYFSALDELENNLDKSCFENFERINTLAEGLKHLKTAREGVKNIDDQVLRIVNTIKEIKHIKDNGGN